MPVVRGQSHQHAALGVCVQASAMNASTSARRRAATCVKGVGGAVDEDTDMTCTASEQVRPAAHTGTAGLAADPVGGSALAAMPDPGAVNLVRIAAQC